MWGDNDPIVEEAQWGVDDPTDRPAPTPLPKYTPPKSYRDLDNPQSAKELADYLSGERYGKNWVQRIPYLGELYNEITTGMGQATDEMGAVLDRLGGTGDAEKRLKRADALGQAADMVMEDGRLNPRLSRGVRGSARSLTQMVPASVGGLPTILGAAGVVRANRGLHEAEEAGLDGPQKYSYAATQASIEMTVTALLSKVGLGGLESQLLGKNIANAGIKGAIKQVGVRTAQEIPEEVIIEAMDASVQTLSGVDPTAATPENLIDTISQTIATTVISTGAVGTAQQAAQLLDKGSVSRRDYKELFPDRQVPNARKRLEDVQKLSEAPQAPETAQPGPSAVPEAPKSAVEPSGVFAEGSEAQRLEERREQLPTLPEAELREMQRVLPEEDPLRAEVEGEIQRRSRFELQSEPAERPKRERFDTPIGGQQERLFPGERKQESLTGQREMFDEITGETKPEAKTWQQAAKQENLPKDQMRDAVEEIHGMQMAQWEEMAPIRQFRQKHFRIIQKLREKDSDAVKRFDEMADEFMRAHPGWVETSDELAQIVRAEPEAKPRKNSPEVLREALELVKGGTLEAVASLADEGPFIASRGPGRNLGRVGKAAGREARRLFTTRGHLPKEVFQQKVRKEGRVASQLKQVEFTLADFNRAAKKVYGGFRRMTPDQMKQLDSVLKGEAEPETIPEPMQPIVTRMRTEIDALSRELIDSGVVEGDLAATVQENIGVYAHRSYKAFDDPKWAENVPEDIRNKAKAWVRKEYPDLSEEEVHGLIENLLYEGKAAESPIALIKSGKLGSKDLSILKRRKGIPEEIRALWGEHTDPKVNYAKSVSNMARMIANHQFLSEVRRQGLGQFFHERPIVNDQGEFKTRIAADASQTMYPLNGLYTTPEIKRAFEDALEPKQHGDIFRWYMRANGIVKFSKTVGSVMTHIRNLLGNTGFAVANGHWRLGNAEGAFKSTMTGLAKLPVKQWRDYFLRLQELGVVEEGARAGEIRDVVKDASRADLDGYVDRSIARRVGKGIIDIYQAEDNIWKVYAFENEKARYRQAHPEWSEQQLEDHAAEIVRNTYPTYSMIPEGVKMVRRFPLVGTFVSFPSEVIRTGFHTIRQAHQELQNPQTRAIGAERAAGILAAATATSAISAASRFLVGATDDEDEDLRQFVPPWSENSQLVHLGKRDSGKYDYIDVSYTDPYEYLKTPVIAMLRGEDWQDSLWNSAMEALEPFLGEEILAEKLLDIGRNKKANGGRVFNAQDAKLKQWEDGLAHIYEALEPGTFRSIRRIADGISGRVNTYGGSYDPKLEAIATFTGHRINQLDVSQGLMFKGREFNNELQEANRILNRTLHSKGTVSDAEIEDAYRRADSARRQLFRDMSRKAQAAIRLGLTRDEVVSALASADVSKVNAEKIIDGFYETYIPTEVPAERREVIERMAVEVSDRPEERQRIMQEARQSGLRAKAKTIARSRPVLGGITAKAADPEGKLRGAALLKARQARFKRLAEDWEQDTESAYRWLKERGLGLKDVLRNYRGTQRGNLLRRWRELGG